MGTMPFTAAQLTTTGAETFNLFNIAGGIAEYLDHAITYECEAIYERYEETHTEEELEALMVMENATWDWDTIYTTYAQQLPHILAETYPEIFTTTTHPHDTTTTPPVQIHPVTEAHTNDPGGWGREYITAKLTINGEALKKLAAEAEITEVNDGHNISGFIRTVDDNYWLQLQVIDALMEHHDYGHDPLHYALEEEATRDNWVSEHITTLQ